MSTTPSRRSRAVYARDVGSQANPLFSDSREDAQLPEHVGTDAIITVHHGGLRKKGLGSRSDFFLLNFADIKVSAAS